MSLLDRIRNWRLNRQIPENQRNKHRWRYAPNGIDKIFLNDGKEIAMYRYARRKLKEKEDLEKENI